MERTHLLYLTHSLLPFWETKLANLPVGLRKLISDVIQRTVEQKPGGRMLEKIKRNVYTSSSPDMDILTSLAVSECLQAESVQSRFPVAE